MVIYPEGGLPGMLMRQRRAIDTVRVQLVPIRPAPRTKIGGPEDVVRLVKEMEDYDREYAKILHLDTKNQVLGVETISIGSLSQAEVHPRETVKGAILNNSASTVFIHNHPSGICEPSMDDMNIYERLKSAFNLVGIDLLDSIIVGKGCHYSFKEGKIVRVPVQVPIPGISEPIMELPIEERRRIARRIAATTGQPVVEAGRTMTVEEVKKLPREERTRIAKGLAASVETEDKVWFITAMTDYITAGADLERRNRAYERLQASRYYNKWFTLFFYEHDRGRAMQHLMNFFKANEQGLGFLNYTYYGFISEYLKAISKPVLGRAGAKVEIKYEPRKIFPWRVVYAGTDETVQTREYPEAMAYYTELEAERGITEEGHTLVKKGHSPHTVSENVQTVNNIEAFLNRRTVDTSRYSRMNPIPESLVIGAAIPEDGFLFAYNVTDDPEGVMRRLRSMTPLCDMDTVPYEPDLGCGLYASGVPEYWRLRSRKKWEFARNLSREQRQRLVDIILSDPRYRKGGGYLADFEVDYLTKDLKQYVETGDVGLLILAGKQPYNVRITAETARKAGIPAPKEPGLIKIKLIGKFINAEGLYSNAEVVNRAQAWAFINKPKLLQWDRRASTQDIVNTWLASLKYSGAFTRSSVSTNPEMVVWDRNAIIDFWIVQE